MEKEEGWSWDVRMGFHAVRGVLALNVGPEYLYRLEMC